MFSFLFSFHPYLTEDSHLKLGKMFYLCLQIKYLFNTDTLPNENNILYNMISITVKVSSAEIVCPRKERGLRLP